jgi:hypothetical protein
MVSPTGKKVYQIGILKAQINIVPNYFLSVTTKMTQYGIL